MYFCLYIHVVYVIGQKLEQTVGYRYDFDINNNAKIYTCSYYLICTRCNNIDSFVCIGFFLFFAEHNASRKNTVPKIFSKSLLSLRTVACFCSTEFCIECNEFPHWPASCQQIKSYVKALDIQNGESEIQRKQIHNKKEKENCD